MTAPYLHDQIFEDIRRNGPDMPADATAIGTPAPKTTVGEFVRQTMRGLGRSGINMAALAPELLTAMGLGANNPVSSQVIRPFVEHYFTKPQLDELDEYWGKPETSGGRGAAILSEIVGSAALGGSIIPRKGPPGTGVPRQRIRPIPGSGGRGFEVVGYSPTPPPPTAPTLLEILSGTAPKRTVPEVRPPTPRGGSAGTFDLVERLWNAKPGTPEANLRQSWIQEFAKNNPPGGGITLSKEAFTNFVHKKLMGPLPEIRPPTPGEMNKIADAMRRAPPESREARLLRDMMRRDKPDWAAAERDMMKLLDDFERQDYASLSRDVQEELIEQFLDSGKRPGRIPPKPKEPPVQIPNDPDAFADFMMNNVSGREFAVDQGLMGLNTLDDLLNLRAFGSRRGPFNTSGKTNMQIMDDLDAPIGNVNPIASADEVAAMNDRPPSRLDITEQMRDPDMMSGKAAQNEISDMRALQERVNEALREDIITESIPAHARTRMAPRIFDVLMGEPARRSAPTLKIKPKNWLEMVFPRGKGRKN